MEAAREDTPDMGRTLYTVKQDIPFPGKTWLERSAAAARARAARARADAAEQDIVSRVTLAFHALARSDGTIEALDAAQALMAQSADVAKAHLAGNAGPADEYLLMQAEAVNMAAMLAQERNDRAIAEAMLAELRRRPRDRARFGRTQAPPLVAPSRDADALLAAARARAPDLAAARSEADEARLMATRAVLEFAPDLMPFYQQQRYDGGDTGRMFGLGLTVPLWIWKPAGALAAARARRDAAAARRDAADAALGRRIAVESLEVASHRRRAEDAREVVIPLLEQAVRIARANYEGGRGDVLRLLTAVRGLLSAQRDYHEEVYRYAEHWAELWRATGGTLEGTP